MRAAIAPGTDTAEPPEAAAPTIPQRVDALVRAAIDARAPSILAGVEEPALSMQVSWSREGRLDALLRGSRQGTPEEECVRAIVQSLSVAPQGTGGTIVHAIQR